MVSAASPRSSAIATAPRSTRARLNPICDPAPEPSRAPAIATPSRRTYRTTQAAPAASRFDRAKAPPDSTRVSARWDDGTDLSGGQWQKLAIGRGRMRKDPPLVLFDEPTAALDSQTEHALSRPVGSAGW
ncbi:ATP-binding cassette domain-containing protein [Glycomyces sp. YM15]|uniref:ATP-binding cassette domain-containing protein n=1 Tax=Glycomyces sp. YM15 TaxID=2800446 RepID=UPI0035AB8EEB